MSTSSAAGRARFSLAGQTALVTGSSRGIGLASARVLAQQGARVIINGRNQATLAQAGDKLRQTGLDVIDAPFDAADIAQSISVVDRLIREHGPIQIFMANAAMQHRESLLTFPQEKFEEIVSLNLTAQWALGRHLAAHMVQREYGRIIVTGSVTALQGRKDITAYTVAKAGLHALARQWAVELSPHNITVNAVAPAISARNSTKACKTMTASINGCSTGSRNKNGVRQTISPMRSAIWRHARPRLSPARRWRWMAALPLPCKCPFCPAVLLRH